MISLRLKDIEDTRRLGACISKVLEPGDIILFHGDLGAGKTTLTRYTAGGLGIEEREVTSPTFNIIHEHLDGKIPLVHVDLYRLADSADILDTGIEEYLTGEFIIMVEWAEHLFEPLSEEYLELDISIQDDTRTALLKPIGSMWKTKVETIKACFEREAER